MSEVKDFCNPPRVVRTGMGWGVRIDGTDVFEGINQHGYKTLRTLDIVIGLSSEQEAKEYLAQWLSDQLPDFDAQRLRADTAEAELEVVRQQHAEQSCIFCNDSGELLSKVKTERLRADTAEAELKREKDFHAVNVSEAERMLAADEQRIADLYSKSAINAAAKKLAECMDYPWEHMPEKGRASMCDHAKSIIDAALNPNPEAESHE